MKKTLLSLALIGCAVSVLAAPARKAPKVMVECGYVFEAANVKTRNYIGQIESPNIVNIVTRVSGDLSDVCFENGQLVKKNQVLYTIDPIRFDAAVKSAEARIAEIKAKLTYAQNNYDRNKSLHKKQVSSKDALENAYSTLQALRAELSMAEATLITAKDDLKNTKISAPMNGKIGATNFSPGNYITPSSGVLSTIVQTDPLRVSFSMSARDFLNTFGNEEDLKKYGVVTLVLANNQKYSRMVGKSNVEYAGRFEFIDNQANSRTDTIRINMLIDNPDNVLLPGNTVTVALSRKTDQVLPAVKLSCIMYDEKGPYVYVVDKNNIASIRRVKCGNMLVDKQFIVSGLKKGELVVTDGMHKIVPNTEVIVKMEKGVQK